MPQQPKTETDRLVNVIQVLQLGQKTGRLIVERNEGPLFEQGIITFVQGQIVQASVNQHQGPDALDWLKSWGACRFTFTPEPRPTPTGHMPTLVSPPPGQRTTGYRTPGTSPLPTPPTGPTYPRQMDTRITGNLRGPGQPTPTAWLATPYRTRHIEEGMYLIERMGLSRAHRRLFLLIDGGRTVKELIRLMAHNPEDTHRLLQDLARAGVIQV
ncbi:MAG TPA: DUF4388 domain-containing protein [Ktedonobacteraceae bacterium]|jgi:hypothetical protein